MAPAPIAKASANRLMRRRPYLWMSTTPLPGAAEAHSGSSLPRCGFWLARHPAEWKPVPCRSFRLRFQSGGPERLHTDWKQKPLCILASVAFSDGKPESTFPEYAPESTSGAVDHICRRRPRFTGRGQGQENGGRSAPHWAALSAVTA